MRRRRNILPWVVLISGVAMAAEPVLEITPGQVRPGDALVVDLRVTGPCPVAWLGDRPLFFHKHRGRCRAIAGVRVEHPPGELPIRIGSASADQFLASKKSPLVKAIPRSRAMTSSSARRTPDGTTPASSRSRGSPEPAAGQDAGQNPAAGTTDAGGVTPSGPAQEWPALPLELPVAGVVEVLKDSFPERALAVAPQFIEPPPSVQQRLEADRRAFAAAFAQTFAPAMFRKNFAWPRESNVTARFGDRRTFNGIQQSQHYGIDLDGIVGAPIRAANDGVVVMVRDNYAAGRTVVIHHGLDMYTAYFHLSRMQVREGQIVKRGQRIGLVGRTGRVTGPHLHWGVRVGDVYVDPASMLRLDLER